MAEFYCIKLIRKSDGVRGWLVDRPTGIEIAVGGVTSDITQFKTEQEALKFIKDHKVERGGISAYVRTNQELLNEIIGTGQKNVSTVSKDKPIYHLENQKGEKLFYDSKKDAYYFTEMGEFGFPIWDNEKEAREFVIHYRFGAGMILLVKHLEERGKYEKIPIQVYGRTKNPDGTEGEFRYIDLKEGDVIKNNPFDDTVH